jgi:enoyl-CoA hydratase/carnithine racemase
MSGDGVEFSIQREDSLVLLTLNSADGLNRLTLAKVVALTEQIARLSRSGNSVPLVMAGQKNFSTGADLNEITRLGGPAALEFAKAGQGLMNAIAAYPALVCAAVSGYCMGGGLDLALACHYRVGSPHAIFGHRGAALGLMTGWGGTQRLPRLVGKARALEMFIAAEKLHAAEALRVGLLDAVAIDPMDCARQRCMAAMQNVAVQLPPKV